MTPPDPLSARCPNCYADKYEACISIAAYELYGDLAKAQRKPHAERIAAAQEIQLPLFITTQGEHDK